VKYKNDKDEKNENKVKKKIKRKISRINPIEEVIRRERWIYDENGNKVCRFRF